MKKDESQSDQHCDEPLQPASFELTATAWHEAGHAVMAVSLGRPIEKVTISPARLQTGGSRLGICKIQKGRTKPSNDQLEDDVLILLAGMVAAVSQDDTAPMAPPRIWRMSNDCCRHGHPANASSNDLPAACSTRRNTCSATRDMRKLSSQSPRNSSAK
jgi:hypothetical protein